MKEPLQLYLPLQTGKGIQNTKHPLKGISACYAILHIPTDSIYVGSTCDLPRRYNENIGDLRRNEHKNRPLQELYNKIPDVVVLFEPCSTVEEAQFLEQLLVDKLKHTDNLCNVAVDNVLLTRKGASLSIGHIQKLREYNLGKVHTDDSRQNMSSAQKSFYGTPEGIERKKQIGEQRSKRITFEGVEYSSIREASKQLNINYSTLAKKVSKFGVING